MRTGPLAFCCALLVAACASTPPNAGAPPATTAVTLAPSAPPTSARNAPSDTQIATAAKISPELAASARRFGYQAKLAGDKVIFCRRQLPVGSHMPELTCIDAQHFDAIAHTKDREGDDAQRLLEDLTRTGNTGTPLGTVKGGS